MKKYSIISGSLFLVALVSPAVLAYPILMAGTIFAVFSAVNYPVKWIGISLIVLNAGMLVSGMSHQYRQQDLYQKRVECLNKIDRTPDIAGSFQSLRAYNIQQAEEKCNEIGSGQIKPYAGESDFHLFLRKYGLN